MDAPSPNRISSNDLVKVQHTIGFARNKIKKSKFGYVIGFNRDPETSRSNSMSDIDKKNRAKLNQSRAKLIKKLVSKQVSMSVSWYAVCRKVVRRVSKVGW